MELRMDRVEVRIINWKGFTVLSYEIPKMKGRLYRLDRDAIPCDDQVYDRDFRSRGIYLFISGDGDRPSVYIGQATDIRNRFLNHTSDDWDWTELVFYANADLSRGEMDCIENDLIKRLQSNKGVQQRNRNQGFSNSSTPSERRDAENTVEQILTLMNVAGLRFMDPLKGKRPDAPEVRAGPLDQYASDDAGVFIITRGGDVFARAVYLGGNRLKVLKGSRVNIGREDKRAGVRKVREDLIADGIITNGAFTSDHVFDSPSLAYNVILSANAGGPSNWKLPDGTTLREVIAKEGKERPEKAAKVPEVPGPEGIRFMLLSKGEVVAYGVPEGDGIRVLAGARILEARPSLPESYAKLRRRLVDDGCIVNGVFVRDHVFNRPSSASDVILGAGTNGKTMWRTEDGRTWKDVFDD